jgi:hypothetical protein
LESLPEEVFDLLRMVEEEHRRAEDAYQYVEFEHSDKEFRAFDPDHIEQASNDELKPLDLGDEEQPRQCPL